MTTPRDPGDARRGSTAASWDARYRARGSVWSGQPNAHLVAGASGLVAGRALEIGSGEGADALWLAERGWRVTAVDFSAVALERAAARAAAGARLAQRIDWVRADVSEWVPAERAYDLVTAHFMQLPADEREPLFRRLAAAVTPGGTLLIVGHHPSDLQTKVRRPPSPELFYTASDVAASLEPADWEIAVRAARARTATDADGQPATVHDTVFQARRRE